MLLSEVRTCSLLISFGIEVLCLKVKILKTLQHENIINFYSSWVDYDEDQVVIITEIMSSGTLNEYAVGTLFPNDLSFLL